jgi:uncharacterized membrane protein YdjX (TVP38/TMEM64 family)
MKSFLLLLITFVAVLAIVGGSSALFYLAKTSEFSKTEEVTPASSAVPANGR